jgi:uncharacterized protein
VNPVFLDTVGLLALWDEDDDWHQPAVKAFEGIKSSRAKMLTTSHVFLECGNAAARRPYRQAVGRLREKLEFADALIHPTHDDWRLAWEAYQTGEGGQAGIIDQISFIVMRRLGLTQAFTNDRHFQAAGFHILF